MRTHPLPFVQVAASTSIGQIFGVRGAPLCRWGYVLNVERPASDQLIAVTIFTAIVGALCDLPAQLLRDVRHWHLPAWISQIAGQRVTLFEQENGFGLAQSNEVFLLDETRGLGVLTPGECALFLEAQELPQPFGIF